MRTNEVSIHDLRDERNDGRCQCAERSEDFVERLIGCSLIGFALFFRPSPEPAPISPNVPIAEAVDEVLYVPADWWKVVFLEVGPHGLRQELKI